MADDDSSELSSLSSLSEPPSEDESDIQLEERQGILKFFHKVDKNPALEPKEKSPPRPKREPSPPHEYVLADNPDIAFIVMFRARFSEAFPKSLANFGPQELERDVVETVPGERVEHFLCALLSLLLNRKQDVKPGHYNRALEEAIQTHKGQWAKDWESQNPLAGQATFASMTPVQRLTLLRTLVQWTLSSSDAVRTIISQQYKNRHDDDLNIPLSVQPWGSDGDKRRYFLIEGNDDTSFRVYRESNPAGLQRTWWSVAGNIEELKALSEKLETQDGGPKAKALAKKIMNSIPRFEATEEKRRRREYRQMRKEQFRRPEPGFSLYEGRTRGKRIKYTYSDDEADFFSDSTTRRSARNTGNHTPTEPRGPVTTASGRQVRAPNRLNAENASDGAPSASASVQGDAQDAEQRPLTRSGRPQRSAAVNHGMNGWASKKRKSDEYESEESDEEDSEPDFEADEEDEHVPEEGSPPRKSLICKFPIRVAFDENNKVRQIPGPPVASEKHKHPRAAHQNGIVSYEESESGETTTTPEEPVVAEPEPEPPAAEVIAVATKRMTPLELADSQPGAGVGKQHEPVQESSADANQPQGTDAGVTDRSLPTPSSEPSAPPALRGSPEAAPSVPQPVGFVSQE
ncbi:f0d56545-0b2e-4581-b213-1f53b02746f3 [Thermothielavioides terrestris]|uniref:F0d56545-0b2e-4581-b213-1f53b02746f3 n=1 Tax=Thermothielavioides terrestris TaxID=2587410 RepID=A0A446BJU6_9PEZI|nr:f0d56545-0b2e-4581-b213-1f53b02746f3 [Thermothielavioides terrestris]